MSRRRLRALVLTVALVLVGVVSACGGGDGGEDEQSADTTAPATTSTTTVVTTTTTTTAAPVTLTPEDQAFLAALGPLPGGYDQSGAVQVGRLVCSTLQAGGASTALDPTWTEVQVIDASGTVVISLSLVDEWSILDAATQTYCPEFAGTVQTFPAP